MAKRTIMQRMASWLVGQARAPQHRSYAATRPGRNSVGFGSSGNSSADAELSLSLGRMRAASRQMVRDSAYAKRARQIIVNNVVGTGIDIEAQVSSSRQQLRENVNDAIEEAWEEWCCADSCHTGGQLHFGDFERAAMGQVFEAGEVFIRKHYSPFGDSEVPLALELIEPERLATEQMAAGPISAQGEMRMGIEVDSFHRPLAYWVRMRHPGDISTHSSRTDKFERVPAEDMFHLRVVDRWPQTRGEPWMHAVLRKFDDLNELTGSELAAVRASSYYFATIKSPEDQSGGTTEEDGKSVMDIEPLMIQQLAPGDELNFHAPNRPNSNLDAFLRHMIREIASGAMVSFESLSRDYSQSNYSSSRLALLEDRDTWRVLQQWWIRTFRMPLHKVWLQQAVLSRAIESIGVAEYSTAPEKFSAVRFKPRGWSWIDPTKEVEAYKEAIKAGLTTLTDVIAQTADGRGIEDVIKTRRRELDMLAGAEIEVDTTVQDPLDLIAAKATSNPPPDNQPADQSARVVKLGARQ